MSKQVIDELRFNLMYCKTANAIDAAQERAYRNTDYRDGVTNTQILKLCHQRREELKGKK